MHVADLDGTGFLDGDFWPAILTVTASDTDGVPVLGATKHRGEHLGTG
jgi:hypothetical protein